jgi:glucose-1-phosphate cytidylyltransferase
MKAVILAGGYGTRISEESQYKPKPMVEIGGMPILWHIMKEYSFYGINDFVICAGYKQDMVKEWFNNYFIYTSDVTFDFTNGKHVILREQHSEPWKVTVVDTGNGTMTGGRIKRIQPYIGDEAFCMTYGDGVCDVNIGKLIEFHKSHGKLATLTAVLQDQSKGVLDIGGDNAVRSFREKTKEDSVPINAGYMVLKPQVFNYLDGDECVFEKEPLRKLAEEGQLMSYQHKGYWQCMDTLREKNQLEKLWKSGKAPWKVWDK